MAETAKTTSTADEAVANEGASTAYENVAEGAPTADEGTAEGESTVDVSMAKGVFTVDESVAGGRPRVRPRSHSSDAIGFGRIKSNARMRSVLWRATAASAISCYRLQINAIPCKWNAIERD